MNTTPKNLSPSGDTEKTQTSVGGNPSVEKSVTSVVSEIIDLPSGKELSEFEAVSLANARPIRWVVVAGPVSCGKTTLLISLYELFQWEPVAGHLFAGSNTLPALEQRCFLSRTASENNVPDTQRTFYNDGDEPTYLHLRVCAEASRNKPIDFLFTDVSGEMYEHARDSTERCKELTCLHRASNFLLLLDCEKGVSIDKRWAMAEDGKTLLQSCLDSEMLSNDCVVNVIWSKFDYFVAAKNKVQHQAFRKGVQKGFMERFGQRVAHLKFGEIAARPTKAPRLGFGYGVADLLNGWMTNYPKMRDMVLLQQSTAGTRESELFAIRRYSTLSKP